VVQLGRSSRRWREARLESDAEKLAGIPQTSSTASFVTLVAKKSPQGKASGDPESRVALGCPFMDQSYYKRLPLGSRVTILTYELHLKRFLERLGFSVERADQTWFVMRRDTGPLLPLVQLFQEGPRAAPAEEGGVRICMARPVADLT
jgi:hypothetical protein